MAALVDQMENINISEGAIRTRYGRIVKKPQLFVPTETVVNDDFGDDEYDEEWDKSDIDTEEEYDSDDSGFDDSDDEDDNGNLKGFVVSEDEDEESDEDDSE
jgi:hypothetical protein